MTSYRGRLALAAATLTVLAAAGCSSAGGGGSDSAAVEMDNSGAASAADGGSVAMEPTGADQRQVIVTADAVVQVEDAAAAADAVVTIVEVEGGRVEARDERAGTGDEDPGSAWLVLRVPADRLSGVIDGLEDIGTVLTVSQSEQDVTSVALDLDARIAALETSTERLLQMMADADDTGDLLATETTLSERQAELESLQSQRDALADEVALSTLTVSLDPEPVTPVEARGGFLGGLESGWNGLVAFLGSLLVVLGVLLPWALALGIPALVVVAVLRHRRRRGAAGRPGDGGPRGGDRPDGDDSSGPDRAAVPAAVQ